MDVNSFMIALILGPWKIVQNPKMNPKTEKSLKIPRTEKLEPDYVLNDWLTRKIVHLFLINNTLIHFSALVQYCC